MKLEEFKGVVHPKIKFLWLFISPFCENKIKNSLKNVLLLYCPYNRSNVVLDPIDVNL